MGKNRNRAARRRLQEERRKEEEANGNGHHQNVQSNPSINLHLLLQSIKSKDHLLPLHRHPIQRIDRIQDTQESRNIENRQSQRNFRESVDQAELTPKITQSETSETSKRQYSDEPSIIVRHRDQDLESDGFQIVRSKRRKRQVDFFPQDSEEQKEQEQQLFSGYFSVEQHILTHYNYGETKYIKQKVNRYYESGIEYKQTFIQLLKHEIASDINKRLEEKEEQVFQQEIQVRLIKRTYADPVTKQEKEHVIIEAIRECDGYWLAYFLIKGKMLGIIANFISKSCPFKISHLNSQKYGTRLCFISQRKTGIIFIEGIEDQNIDPDKIYYFIFLDSIITFKREVSAIAQLDLESKIGREIYRVKMDSEAHWTNHNKSGFFNHPIYKKILKERNESQSSTIWKIFKKQSGIYLIQGPPGTGKTQTIANYASLEYEYEKNKYYISDDSDLQGTTTANSQKVIMICAQSNAAVNNVARKLLKAGFIGKKCRPELLRLGHTEEYDQDILSINLPHLCQIELMKKLDLYNAKYKSSAKLRWEKKVITEKINKMEVEQEVQTLIKKEKDILNRIVEDMVKIFRTIKSHDIQYKKIEMKLLEKSEIVFTTLSTSGKHDFLQFYSNKVKCLIIDQAAQATEPSTLIPFQTKVKKVILVGDHKQLQPTVMSMNCRFTHFNRSMFERMVMAGKPAELLNTQYRMLSELRRFPSAAFYHNKLQDGIKDMKPPKSLEHMKDPSWFFDISYGREQMLRKSYQNEAEANIVVYLAERMLQMGKELTIGIIAPYRSQIKNIENQFLKKKLSDQKMNRLKISTVDSFQGQERDVIIMTCVKANEEQKIGFVRDWKRLNVSITRAKYALIVFGDSKTLSVDGIWHDYLQYHCLKRTYVLSKCHEQTKLYLKENIIDKS